MKIKAYGNYDIELSYDNLIAGLMTDIQTDYCMHTEDKRKINKLLSEVFDIIDKYSY